MDDKRRQVVVGLSMLDQKDPAPRFVMGYYYNMLKENDVIPMQSIFTKPDVKQALDNLLTLFGGYAAEFGLQRVNQANTGSPVKK